MRRTEKHKRWRAATLPLWAAIRPCLGAPLLLLVIRAMMMLCFHGTAAGCRCAGMRQHPRCGAKSQRRGRRCGEGPASDDLGDVAKRLTRPPPPGLIRRLPHLCTRARRLRAPRLVVSATAVESGVALARGRPLCPLLGTLPPGLAPRPPPQPSRSSCASSRHTGDEKGRRTVVGRAQIGRGSSRWN